MDYITLLWGLVGLLAMLLCGYCPDERRKRILKDRSGFLRARVQDVRDFFLRVHRGKNQNLDEDLVPWLDEALELIRKSECLTGHVGGWMGFFISAKFNKLIEDIEAHDKKGGELLIHVMFEVHVRGGHYLPVKEVVGQSASKTLEKLELFLQDDEVRRIAICGVKGVGKTFLMKHLHNYALNLVKKFNHVFWVTLQDQSTIRHAQDAIATAVNCDLNSDDALNVRANKLSDSLSGLVDFALFVDGVGADFSVNQIGIPVSVEGNKCKLILTSSLDMENSLLNRFETIKVDPLLEDEAYQCFLHEAKIGEGSNYSLGGIPRLLVNGCCGVPFKIVNLATCMFGIDDICEWRNALFELGLEMGSKFPCEGVIRQLKCDSKKLKRDVLPSSYAFG